MPENRAKIWVLPYTSDLSGSNVALWRMLCAVDRPERFRLLLHPDSWLATKATQKGWDFWAIHNPVLRRGKSLWGVVDFLKELWVFSKELNSYRQREEPAVIWVNCLTNISWLFSSAFWPFFSRPPIFWWIHEYHLQPIWIASICRTIVGRTADRIGAVSPLVMKDWKGLPGKRGHGLLTNIVPKCEYDLSVDLFGASYRYMDSYLNLLWIGTASPRKGLGRLPEILRNLAVAGYQGKLEIAAALAPHYREWAHQVLQELKQVHGFEIAEHVNRDDLTFLYHPKKILMQTMEQPESFNLSAFEAMACGVAVISTDTGGLKEMSIEGSFARWDGTAKELIGILKEWEMYPSLREKMVQLGISAADAFDANHAVMRFWKEMGILNAPR